MVKRYLDKGRPVTIEGRLKTSSWETEDGQKRSRAFIRANTIQMLGGRAQEAQAGATLSTDDIPF